MGAPRPFSRLIREDGSVLVPAWLAPAVLAALRIGLLVLQRQNGEGRLSPAMSALLVDLAEAANRAPAPEMSARGHGSDEGRTMGSSQDAEMLTASEAALVFGSDARTIRRLCQQGRLVATKRGRDWVIRSRDLAAFRKDRAA